MVLCFQLTIGQSIVINSISNIYNCQGAALNVNYSISGIFNSGNQFRIEISDQNGNFGQNTFIGSVTSTNATTVNGTIPNNQTPGTQYRLRIVSTNPIITSADNGTDIVINAPQGNPNDFGANTWNVYAYNGNNFNNYRGFYTHNSLNFDSRNVWTQSASPSSASGYLGCAVPADQHSFSYKHQGFPANAYRIDIAAHDDNIEILVDGISVFNFNGCCQAHNNVWNGYLGANSTVEIRTREFGGSSYAAVNFVPIKLVQASADVSICNGNQTTLTVSGADTYVWTPSNSLNINIGNSVVASPNITTTYIVTGTHIATGASQNDTVIVIVTNGFNIQVTGNTNICQGESTNLLASGGNQYTWSPSIGLNTTTGSAVIASPTSTTQYKVHQPAQGACPADSELVTINVTIPPGNPNDFGNNTWNVYAYNGFNFTTYRGMYT
jgi:hypothetical protein